MDTNLFKIESRCRMGPWGALATALGVNREIFGNFSRTVFGAKLVRPSYVATALASLDDKFRSPLTVLGIYR